MSAPELLDFSKEPAGRSTMYGVDEEPTRAFATNCLLARRMVERGVRFVMLTHAVWDHHTELNKKLKKNCDITAGPVAALIQDLKQRGLLDSTLVVWGGEFGRTPMVEIRQPEEPTTPAAIIIPLASPCGWPAAASGRAVDRQDRRSGLDGRRGPGPRARSAGDHPALPGPRSHAADLPPHGPRLPAHRCARRGRPQDAGVDPNINSQCSDAGTEASLLAETMRNQGFRVFLDVDTHQVGDLERITRSALEQSRAVIVLVGPQFARRVDEQKDWVRLELEAARKLGKDVLPIVLPNTDFNPSDLPFQLRWVAESRWLRFDRTRVAALVDEVTASFGVRARSSTGPDSDG